MEPGDDHTRPSRRSTDMWTDERITDAMARVDNQLDALNPLPTQIAKLEVRLDRAMDDISKIDIGAALRRVEQEVSSLHGKLDADMEGLKDTFIPRNEMPALYVPRKEHEKRVQAKMQWPAVVLAVVMIISQLVILLHTVNW